MRFAAIALILLAGCSYQGLPPDYEDALRTLETEARRDAASARTDAELVASFDASCGTDNATDCADAIRYGASSLNASAENLTKNARLACAVRYHADQSGGGFVGFVAGVLDWFGLPVEWLVGPLDLRMQAGQCDV